MTRQALALAFVAALLGVACAGDATPTEVVERYFASVGRDPMRTLPITTDAFHRGHGLVLAARSGAGADEGRAAWLAVQSRVELIERARALRTTIESTDAGADADTASVRARVVPPRGAPFEQRFALVRDGGGWRIDAIGQSGVAADNAADAFAAYPNEAGRRAVIRY